MPKSSVLWEAVDRSLERIARAQEVLRSRWLVFFVLLPLFGTVATLFLSFTGVRVWLAILPCAVSCVGIIWTSRAYWRARAYHAACFRQLKKNVAVLTAHYDELGIVNHDCASLAEALRKDSE